MEGMNWRFNYITISKGFKQIILNDEARKVGIAFAFYRRQMSRISSPLLQVGVVD
jgi:hypothetical protein